MRGFPRVRSSQITPRTLSDAAPSTALASVSTGGSWKPRSRCCTGSTPVRPLGDPRRHPRSAPRPRLRHHLLATTAQQVTPSGVLRLLTMCGCKDRDLRAESHRQPPVLRHGQRAHRVGGTPIPHRPVDRWPGPTSAPPYPRPRRRRPGGRPPPLSPPPTPGGRCRSRVRRPADRWSDPTPAPPGRHPRRQQRAYRSHCRTWCRPA